MRKILTILIAVISIQTFGQIPTDPATKKFIYEAVVGADSIKGDAIYNNAKEWLSRNLKSSDNNISFDKDSKTMTTTGNIHLENRVGWCEHKDINLNFKFSVFVKDGRYKYIVENFYVSYYNVCGLGSNSPISEPFEELDFGNKQKEKVYNEADTKVKGMISELEKYIKSPTSAKKDW